MNLPLRPNVCMLVLNSEGKLVLGGRQGNPGVWQFPQGGVDESSTVEASVLRELEEELGADRHLFAIIKKLDAVNEYDWEVPPPYGVGRWRGQSQTFWLVRFDGSDSDIDLSRYDEEMMDFRWCSVPEVRALAEAKRLPGYEKAISEAEAYIAERYHCDGN